MSISIVSADEIESLRTMFPQETQESLRAALHRHKGDLGATVESLLAGARNDRPPPTVPAKREGWACPTCTFENRTSSRHCAMCDTPAPTETSTSAPSTPAHRDPPTQTATLDVPPWWDTFWADHRAQLQCDERAAKEILFANGQFKNSQILTLDIKNRVFRILGVDEVHRVEESTYDDDGSDDYGFGFPPRPIGIRRGVRGPKYHPGFPPYSSFHPHPPAMG